MLLQLIIRLSTKNYNIKSVKNLKKYMIAPRLKDNLNPLLIK